VFLFAVLHIVGTAPDAVHPNCTLTGCFVLTRPNIEGTYRVVATRTEPASKAVAAARLLLQGTFGPMKEEVLRLANTTSFSQALIEPSTNDTLSVLEWIREQIALPPTYHRVHFRERVNPRMVGDDPSISGILTGPCDQGNRWHRFAFTRVDVAQEIEVEPSNVSATGHCYLSMRVHGVLRSQPASFDGLNCNLTLPANTTHLRYVICQVNEEPYNTGDKYSFVDELEYAGPFGPDEVAACTGTKKWSSLPLIDFHTPESSTTQLYGQGELDFSPVVGKHQSFYLRSRPEGCTGAAYRGNSFIGAPNATDNTTVFYRLDIRRRLVTNTMESPANVNSSSVTVEACPTVEKNPFNLDTCVRRQPSESCSTTSFESASVHLNDETMLAWFDDSSKYVYYVTGLRVEDVGVPCTDGLTSRWIRRNGNCNSSGLTVLDNSTGEIAISALRAHATGEDSSRNPGIRDVRLGDFTGGRTCSQDPSTRGAAVDWDGDCWQHTHPDEWNVYDFSTWVFEHPGSLDALSAGQRDPIRRGAEERESAMLYPLSHPMSRWDDNLGNEKYASLLGRVNDTVNFAELPVSLQTTEMAGRVGAVSFSSSLGFEACGSRGEVANNNSYGHLFIGDDHKRTNYQGLDRMYWIFYLGSSYIFQTVALSAEDQLRQRVAWALSQFIVAMSDGVTDGRNAEVYTNFHDILVHNALGNYGDILREVSASPLMAQYLTFLGNKAFAVDGKYPDENYAREIMQLFSIGVWELNLDGTEKRDPITGTRFPTYDNDDILDAAKVWTGWFKRSFRGNLIRLSRYETNMIDPMELVLEYRDQFPKTKVGGGYLGDDYPLCSELPSQHYLKKGAKYVLHGWTSALGSFYDTVAYGNNSKAREHFTPSSNSSSLFTELCAADSESGKCTFPPVVVLNHSVSCSGPVECEADTLRVVKMVDPLDNETLYYTYEEKPCVQLLYFNNGRVVMQKSQLQCADPNLVTIASVACCASSSSPVLVSNGGAECLYLAEPMKYTTAASRCDAIYGTTTCRVNYGQFPNDIERNENTTGEAAEWAQMCSAFQHRWTNRECSLQVQIDYLGVANVVDPNGNRFMKGLEVNSGSTFKVLWNPPANGTHTLSGPRYPVVHDGSCGMDGCEALPENGGTCLCETWVQHEAVYTDANAALPTPAAMRSKLFIGAFVPEDYGGTANEESGLSGYTLCTTEVCTSQSLVSVYSKGNNPNPTAFDEDTIFELRDALGRRSKGRYFLNRVSNVFLGTSPHVLVPLSVSNCSSSSEYPQFVQNVSVYACENALDGVHGTQWATSGETVGAWMMLNFSRPVSISRFLYVNRQYNRANKHLRLEFSDGSNQTVVAPASTDWEYVSLALVRTTFVKIVVESIHDGSLGTTGAREIQFFGPHGLNEPAYVNRGFNFRNPPNFNPKVGSNEIVMPNSGMFVPYEDSFRVPHALHETNALIDNLLEHDNTAPFVATRLIQRLVTSNPSPRYVKSVATAFRTGTYDDHMFSGEYGDLSATVAAVLLDREARSPELDADLSHGQVREPLLKVLHMMRSMDYTSKAGVEVMLYYMDTAVGQGSYQAPDVFSFLLPDYAPDGPISDRKLVSPESRMSTAPLIIGYLNGMYSLITHGLTNCQLGFGDRFGIAEKHKRCHYEHVTETADGYLTYSVGNVSSSRAEQAAAVVDELGLLLTAGRLSENSRAVLTNAYGSSSYSDDEAFKHLLQLFAVTPEFHITNKPAIQRKRRGHTAKVQSQGRPYRAVVVVLVSGGADSFNLLVPHTCNEHDLYTEYAQLRGGSNAIAKESLLEINVSADSDPQPCTSFGLHPSLTFLHSTFEAGDAVAFSNVGGMVEPISQHDFYAKNKRQPLGNFGHRGMATAMQSLNADDKTAKGVLGRMAKAALNKSPPMKTALYSACGAQKIVEGGPVPSFVQSRVGVVRYKQYDYMKDEMSALNANVSSSVFAEAYSEALETSLQVTEELGGQIENTTLETDKSTFKSSVGLQLLEVAKLIAVDTQVNNMERAGFVVEQRQYDAHSSFEDLTLRLDDLDPALEAFSEEMKAQGLWKNVTVILVSDFGRTLSGNTRGTDHGWGGNTFMFGGSVRGGRIAGAFPNRLIEEESEVSCGRGRIIPTKPWEAIWKGIAEWWDLDDPDSLSEILPLASNWNSNELFNKTHLYKSGY